MPCTAEHVAVHLRKCRLFQLDFGADALHLLDGRIRGQRALLRLLGDGLMNHVIEQVRPAKQAAGRVDNLEIKQPVIIGRAGHQRKHRYFAAIAGHERAEHESVNRVRVAVCAGHGHIRLEFRREQVLRPADEVGQPADVLLELWIGLLDHLRVEADTADNHERMRVVFVRVVQQG